MQGGFAQWLTPGGAPRPRLALPLLETRQPLPLQLQKLAERIANGDDLKSAQDLRDANLGSELGWFGQTEGQWFLRSERPMVKAYAFMLPAERMLREAALVGVPRLRHRAKTSNAGRWRADLGQVAAETIAEFKAVIAERVPSLLVDAEHRLADFNGGSM